MDGNGRVGCGSVVGALLLIGAMTSGSGLIIGLVLMVMVIAGVLWWISRHNASSPTIGDRVQTTRNTQTSSTRSAFGRSANTNNALIYQSDIPRVSVIPGKTALLVEMDYMNRQGEMTHRRVRIDEIDLDHEMVLRFAGQCELRMDRRNFSTRGIVAIHHAGRRIDRDAAPAFIKRLHLDTVFGRTDLALESAGPLVDVLSHIAKASGNVSPSERRIIMSVVVDSVDDGQIDEDRVRKRIRECVLSPKQYKDVLSRIAVKGGVDLQILRKLVDDMDALKTSSEDYTSASITIARQILR